MFLDNLLNQMFLDNLLNQMFLDNLLNQMFLDNLLNQMFLDNLLNQTWHIVHHHELECHAKKNNWGSLFKVKVTVMVYIIKV